MYLELIQHANIVALSMNGKIDLFSLAFGAEKKITLLQILIQLKICSVELARIIVMEVKIMMNEKFILLIYNLAMIDQALEKFEQEEQQ